MPNLRKTLFCLSLSHTISLCPALLEFQIDALAHVFCVSMLKSLAGCVLSMAALPSVCLPVCLSSSLAHTQTHSNTHSQDLVTYHFLPVTNYAHINFYKTFLALPFYFMFLFVTTASHTHSPAHTHTHTGAHTHALNASQFSLRT